MSIPDNLKTQINLSIAYIAFLFLIFNTFPRIATTGYGFSVGDLESTNFLVTGFQLWKGSLYSLFLFLLTASVQITFHDKYKIYYNLSQFFFVLSIIFMVIILIFPISFLSI